MTSPPMAIDITTVITVIGSEEKTEEKGGYAKPKIGALVQI